MNLETVWKPVLLYTGLLGLLTVGAVYLATYSGVFMLIVAGSGLLLVVLGGGTAGIVDGSGASNTGGDGQEVVLGGDTDGMDLWPHTNTETSPRHVLLFYGSGLLLWSLTVLSTLSDTLA
jgi:hypothetical protein